MTLRKEDSAPAAEEPTVKMVGRVVAVLRALASARPSGLAVTEVGKVTGLSKTTVHRLLTALVATGLVYQETDSRDYRLGSEAAFLGNSASEQFVAGMAFPVLERLAARTGDAVFASVREGLAAVCVARAVGAFPIKTLTLDVGDRRPLGVGAGSLALLSFVPNNEIDEIIFRNKRWLQDFEKFGADDLRPLIERTRRAGYALNEGRIVAGMNGIAVPVFGPGGSVLAALSVAAIRDRMGPERLPELVELLQAEARELASALALTPVLAA